MNAAVGAKLDCVPAILKQTLKGAQMKIHTRQMEDIDIEVGTILQNLDPRFKTPVKLRVIEIDRFCARVHNALTNRTTNINISRLEKSYGHKNGYKVMET